MSGEDFELIQMVKMETRNPTEGYFGSEFSTICNHFTVIAAKSRKMLAIFEKCLHFLEKRPFTVKLSKFCTESLHCDTFRRVVFKYCEISLMGNQ